MTTKQKNRLAAPVDPASNGAIDFGFQRLEIADKTSRFEMPEVAPEAFLLVRPASEANPQYNAGMLRMSGKRQRAIASKGSMTVDDTAKDRADDKSLYPRYVIVGWGGIFNAANELVEFSAEAAKDLIKQLPNWIFDRLRIHCMRPANFIEDGEDGDEPNPTELAGN